MNNILCFAYAAVTKNEQAIHYRRVKALIKNVRKGNKTDKTKEMDKINKKLRMELEK